MMEGSSLPAPKGLILPHEGILPRVADDCVFGAGRYRRWRR